VGNGENIVDVTYVGDAARAHILAAIALLERPEQAGGRPYFISQGEPIRLWWMIDEMLRAAGQPPVKGAVPYPLAYGIGWIMEIVHRILGSQGEPIMTPWVAAELATSHWFNIEAARTRLGYEPSVTVAEGLVELARWCADNPVPER
jgi:nucleoside-diphosphate-sugar epimerase